MIFENPQSPPPFFQTLNPSNLKMDSVQSKPLDPGAIPFVRHHQPPQLCHPPHHFYHPPLPPHHQPQLLYLPPHNLYHPPLLPHHLPPAAAPQQRYPSYASSFRYNPAAVPLYNRTRHGDVAALHWRRVSAVEPQLKQGSSVSNHGAAAGQKFPPVKKNSRVKCVKRPEIWKPTKVEETILAPSADKLPENITTVMIKNLPNRLREDLVWIMDKHCEEDNEQAKLTCAADTTLSSSSSYDFVYLPMDFHSGLNLGYAFVNFTTNEAALRVHRSFHKCQWNNYKSKKVCEVTPAKIQGLEDLKRQFSDSKFVCDAEEFLPVVYDPPRDGGVSSSSSAMVLGRCVGPSSSSSSKDKRRHRLTRC